MESGKVKKVILLVCVLAAVGIWSYNLTIFFPGPIPFRMSTPPEQTSIKIPEKDMRVQMSTTFVYHETGRDPFRPFFSEKKPLKQEKDVKKTKSKPVEIIPPALDIVGILWDSENPQVILADSSGETHVLRCGDSIGEIKVTKINRKEVWYLFKNKTFKLSLPEG